MPEILIIDDDEELFNLLAEYLKSENFLCSHASDGFIGLEKSNEHTFDLIILDVMLPGINGFEVLQLLREKENTRIIPIVMLTAKGEEIDTVVGLEMGADDYLAKPFSPRELVARLRALLRRTTNTPAHKQTCSQHDDIHIDHGALCVTINQHTYPLSFTELRLLDLLLQNKGQLVKRETLYQSIFGHSAYPSDRSLDMLVVACEKN